MATPKYLVVNNGVPTMVEQTEPPLSYIVPKDNTVKSFSLLESVPRKLEFINMVRGLSKHRGRKENVDDVLIAKIRGTFVNSTTATNITERVKRIMFAYYQWATTVALQLSAFDAIKQKLGDDEAYIEDGAIVKLHFLKPHITFGRFQQNLDGPVDLSKIFHLIGTGPAIIVPTVLDADSRPVPEVWPSDNINTFINFDFIYLDPCAVSKPIRLTHLDAFVEEVYSYACANEQVSRDEIRQNTRAWWTLQRASPYNTTINFSYTFPSGFVKTSTPRGAPQANCKPQFSLTPIIWERSVNSLINLPEKGPDYLRLYSQHI